MTFYPAVSNLKCNTFSTMKIFGEIMKSHVARIALIGSFAMLALARTVAAADIYPAQPITIVVPNAAGGPTDAIARSIGHKLSTRLGQPVVIDNRSGAGGSIGAEYVARAKPDGYTLFLATTGTLAINPALYDKLRYNAKKDFEPIGIISTTSNVLVVRSGLPVKDVKDLIALAKREPDQLTYGSAGNGTSNHLAAAMFGAMTGTRLRHVPYKSASVLKVDLWEGRIDMVFGTEGNIVKEFMTGGKVRALLATGTRRSVLLPDVPTAEEAGLKGYDVSVWFGLVAPAGTPAKAVERINKELNAILATPEMRKELASDGQTPGAMTPQQFGAFLEQERNKWVPVVKASGAKIE
ncbi:tripartite tricarboxylate transporter substrate binding protein (plasmid) [Polaromonas hydrogenivorans]|uniref:Tripartite tricarboxylate transporter substrate binding protein n=2 Tax=Polaromonas hydrogenivorans TaxID=335476 RepID=A0AAU7LZA5_9BURK